MKTKILEALKNKYKNLGFGEKAFDGVASFLSTSVKEEKDIETAISGVEVLLKGFQSDTDKTRSEKAAAEKKLAEIEAKMKELEGGTTNSSGTGSEPIESKDQTPAWGKKLFENMESLTKELTTLKSEKTVSTRTAQLNAIIKDLPESLKKPYSRMSIKDLSDEDFTKLTTEVSTEVKGIIEDSVAKGAVFGTPSTTGANSIGKKEATKEETEKIVNGYNI